MYSYDSARSTPSKAKLNENIWINREKSTGYTLVTKKEEAQTGSFVHVLQDQHLSELGAVLVVVLYIAPLVACGIAELIPIGGGEVVEDLGTSGA